MEFLTKNYFQTTTEVAVLSGTITVENLLDFDERRQYVSSGFNVDNTVASVTITFDATQSVSRISMREFNVSAFTIFYDGVTANTFAITSGDTTVTDYSGNADTHKFFNLTSVSCLSVTFDLKSTMVANNEKAVGNIIITDTLLDFERTPASKNYKPKFERTQVRHVLSDGSVRLQNIAVKRSADIKFKHITRAGRDNLKTVYDLDDEMIFIPFGTTTGWDEFIMPCVWEGDFDFFRFSDDAVNAGFSGQIKLLETS